MTAHNISILIDRAYRQGPLSSDLNGRLRRGVTTAMFRTYCFLRTHQMRSLRPILSALGAVALFLMLATGTVKAVQTVVPPTPKLRGTIKDPSGALMAGVDIAILQGATVVKAGKTNPEGSFSFDLAAGAYKIAVA